MGTKHLTTWWVLRQLRTCLHCMFCRSIAQFYRACHWSVTWARCVNYILVYITVFSFFVILMKHQGEHFGFMITVGHVFISRFLVGGSECECDWLSYRLVSTNEMSRSCRVWWDKVAVIEDGQGVCILTSVTGRSYHLNNVRCQIHKHKVLVSSYCHCVILIPCWTKCQDMMP
jgi:hypothetical protein